MSARLVQAVDKADRLNDRYYAVKLSKNEYRIRILPASPCRAGLKDTEIYIVFKLKIHPCITPSYCRVFVNLTLYQSGE
jgi:hypothetical protein